MREFEGMWICPRLPVRGCPVQTGIEGLFFFSREPAQPSWALASFHPPQVVAQQDVGHASQASGPLTEAEARSAAGRILDTLRRGDAAARYAQFSEDLKRMTSAGMVAETINQQPRITSYRILSVQPGLYNTTVKAAITTSEGPDTLMLILDEQGKLEGYNYNRSDLPATKVVQSFMDYILRGHFISARSYLSPEMQEELTPAVLQEKWQNLQKLTGNALNVSDIVLTETAGDEKLVLVTTQFTRLTDTIFVILDTDNKIVNLDFPADPATPDSAP